MAYWKHKAFSHRRIDTRLYQVNIPINRDIAEHEVVALVNGVVVDRAVFWDFTNSHQDSIDMMHDAYLENLEPKRSSDYDYTYSEFDC